MLGLYLLTVNFFQDDTLQQGGSRYPQFMSTPLAPYNLNLSFVMGSESRQ